MSGVVGIVSGRRKLVEAAEPPRGCTYERYFHPELALHHAVSLVRVAPLLINNPNPEEYSGGVTRYTEQSLHRPLRIGVIGAGMMGDLKNGILAGATYAEFPHQVVGVLPSSNVQGMSPEKRAALAKRGVTAELTAPTIEDLIARRPDVIIIATSNESHKDYTMAALKAGIHVYCEKPVVLSFKDAQEIIQEAERQNLYVGSNSFYKHYGVVRALGEICQTGKIGETSLGAMTGVRVQYLQFWIAENGDGKWRERAPFCGARDLGPHVYEMLEVATGGMGVDFASLTVNASLNRMPDTFLDSLTPLQRREFKVKYGRPVEEFKGMEFKSSVHVEAAGRFNNSVPFEVCISQITPLKGNHHCVQVNFERASLSFNIEDPDTLTLTIAKSGIFFGEQFEKGDSIPLKRGDLAFSMLAETPFAGLYPGGHVQGHKEAQGIALTHELLDGLVRCELERSGAQPIGKPVSDKRNGWKNQVLFVDALSI